MVIKVVVDDRLDLLPEEFLALLRFHDLHMTLTTAVAYKGEGGRMVQDVDGDIRVIVNWLRVLPIGLTS